MPKTILLTGATDGIGLATAKMLTAQGHRVLLHGRNPEKLETVVQQLSGLANGGQVESHMADLSRMDDVEGLVKAVREKHDKLDVLINNAGIFKTPAPITPDGFDVRFAVNTIAPYLLTQRLLTLMDASGRVINLSSAAQAPVDPDALTGRVHLSDDFDAYAQSKLALIMWSRHMALTLKESGPVIVAVNPGSLLDSKMVKEAFGQARGGVDIGAAILVRAALSDEFKDANGQYFDNDSGRFAPPHADALDPQKCEEVVRGIETIIS